MSNKSDKILNSPSWYSDCSLFDPTANVPAFVDSGTYPEPKNPNIVAVVLLEGIRTISIILDLGENNRSLTLGMK